MLFVFSNTNPIATLSCILIMSMAVIGLNLMLSFRWLKTNTLAIQLLYSFQIHAKWLQTIVLLLPFTFVPLHINQTMTVLIVI